MEVVMAKVAIVLGKEIDKYDDYSTGITSITEWEIVDDDTLNILCRAQHKYDFRVLVQPENTKEFINKTVSDYVEMLAEKERLKDVQRQRDKQEAENERLAKLAKCTDDKRKLFEQLKVELGESVRYND
jgi:hypothetical protein